MIAEANKFKKVGLKRSVFWSGEAKCKKQNDGELFYCFT